VRCEASGGELLAIDREAFARVLRRHEVGYCNVTMILIAPRTDCTTHSPFRVELESYALQHC
jgi:hypothetical protein